MTSQKFKITNLECPACVSLSVDVLKDIPGVIEASVDRQSGQVSLQSEKEIDWQKITEALKEVGKEATLN